MSNDETENKSNEIEGFTSELSLSAQKISKSDIINGVHCKLSLCPALQRIVYKLHKYYLYIQLKAKQDCNIYESDNYSNTNILNDFNHLLYVHEHHNQFEDIYNILICNVYNYQICHLSKCLLLKRNQRNRSQIAKNEYVLKELYFINNRDSLDDNITHIIQQQLLDRIHSHYLHSFDIGYKLTRKEKQKYNHSIDMLQMFHLIESKKNNCRNLKGLQRINAKNSKYVDVSDEKGGQSNHLNQYSFGIRYFYWNYYKNNMEKFDDAKNIHCDYSKDTGAANDDNSTVGQWFVCHKYTSLKEEMLLNHICVIGKYEWKHNMEKAKCHMKTHKVVQIFCPRKKSAKYYDMKYGQGMHENHLMAMQIYCNNDVLQAKFSETFRYGMNESRDSLKDRHANYYWFARLLRECVECFGMDKPCNVEYIRLYRGVSKQFTFASMFANIRGPFSTTNDYCVAANFSTNIGMILEISVNTQLWCFKHDEDRDAFNRITCFDAAWISDFSNEQEIFCIGGLNPFCIETVIDVFEGINYDKYIVGLKQMTANMSHGHYTGQSQNGPALTSNEKQMVFRLLSHELFQYYPQHELANEFKSCPQYFKMILHSHCTNVKGITFEEKPNKVNDLFFRKENGWIKLQLLTNIFPNLEKIDYIAFQKDVSFFKQSHVMESLISFISQNKKSNLRIRICMMPKYKHAVSNYIAKYRQQLHKYSWKVEVFVMPFGDYIVHIMKSVGMTQEKISKRYANLGIPTSQLHVMIQQKKYCMFAK